MTGPFFVDTNILVYADDRSDRRKQTLARDLVGLALTSGKGRLSTQVLTEFFAVATRKLGLAAATVRRRVEVYASLPVFRPAAEDLLNALAAARIREAGESVKEGGLKGGGVTPPNTVPRRVLVREQSQEAANRDQGNRSDTEKLCPKNSTIRGCLMIATSLYLFAISSIKS